MKTCVHNKAKGITGLCPACKKAQRQDYEKKGLPRKVTKSKRQR
jgi:hypothetical protein